MGTVGEPASTLAMERQQGKVGWGRWGGVGITDSQGEDLISKADGKLPGREWCVCLHDGIVILKKTREIRHTGPEPVKTEG